MDDNSKNLDATVANLQKTGTCQLHKTAFMVQAWLNYWISLNLMEKFTAWNVC